MPTSAFFVLPIMEKDNGVLLYSLKKLFRVSVRYNTAFGSLVAI